MSFNLAVGLTNVKTSLCVPSLVIQIKGGFLALLYMGQEEYWGCWGWVFVCP